MSICSLMACAALLAVVVLAGCDAACGNEVLASVRSPSGEATAVVFNRNCGATTGFNTQISVLKRQPMTPAEAGNILIADGTLPVAIRWLSDTQLRISGVRGAKIFKQETRVFDVTISYD